MASKQWNLRKKEAIASTMQVNTRPLVDNSYVATPSKLLPTWRHTPNFCRTACTSKIQADRFWAGLSSDLVIEQVLMRSVKSSGGLTHGRGMAESQRAQWLLSIPACASISSAMQEFTSRCYASSGQQRNDKNKTREG